MEISLELLTSIGSGLVLAGAGATTLYSKFFRRNGHDHSEWNGEEKRTAGYVSTDLCAERHKSIEKRLDEGNEKMEKMCTGIHDLTSTVQIFIATHDAAAKGKRK